MLFYFAVRMVYKVPASSITSTSRIEVIWIIYYQFLYWDSFAVHYVLGIGVISFLTNYQQNDTFSQKKLLWWQCKNAMGTSMSSHITFILSPLMIQITDLFWHNKRDTTLSSFTPISWHLKIACKFASNIYSPQKYLHFWVVVLCESWLFWSFSGASGWYHL